MKAFGELVAQALVGTQRLTASGRPLLPADVAALVPADGPAEEWLLDAAAACALYARCGGTPGTEVNRPPVSEPDETAECTPKAADVLTRLLAGHSDELLLEWLAAASAVRRRPPARFLPYLFDRAAERKILREPAAKVIDRRGHWLARHNPRWRFAGPAPTDAEATWQTGTRDERLAALRIVREADTARGRQLVADTWAADPADDRVRWLGVLRSGLSAEDEAFLESTLDDRSSRVREAAADLLAGLPGSQLVTRMAERLEPLVVFTAAKAGSLLKLKGKQPAILTVTLPAGFDKTMLRDGMTEKPSSKLGQKQWWLIQMLGSVPPSHWSTRFGASPADLVTAVDPDFADTIVAGWRTATARHPDPAWAVALARSPVGSNRWSAGYLSAVPEAERPGVLAELATADPAVIELGNLLSAWAPVSAAVSRAAVERFTPEQLLAASAAARIHPSALILLEPGLTELSGKPYVGRAAGEALNTISLRRTIHTEFAE